MFDRVYLAVTNAIGKSRYEEEVVHLHPDEDDFEAYQRELHMLSDDSEEDGEVMAFWGRKWCVHLHRG